MGDARVRTSGGVSKLRNPSIDVPVDLRVRVVLELGVVDVIALAALPAALGTGAIVVAGRLLRGVPVAAWLAQFLKQLAPCGRLLLFLGVGRVSRGQPSVVAAWALRADAATGGRSPRRAFGGALPKPI